MAVIHSKSSRGTTVIELIAFIGLYLLFVGMIVPGVQRFASYIDKLEVYGFCKNFAEDIETVQRKSLWYASIGKSEKITINLAKQSYSIFSKGAVIKTIYLNDSKNKNIYFESPSTSVISFSNNGAPQRYFSILVRHKKVSGFIKKIEVQPVTGRVVISDIK